MKKIIFISICILFNININAQTIVDYRSKIENIFQNVDKTQISTGILSEYGLDFIKLDNYTGTALFEI